MRDIYVNLRQLAGTLQVGETWRGVCDFCGGGSQRETSFNLTRTDDAECVYHCHRASCGRSGRLACWGFRLLQRIDNSPKPATRFTSIRVFHREIRRVGDFWLSELARKYALVKEDIARGNWSETIDDESLVCPVYSPSKVQRGIEIRIHPSKRGDYLSKTRLYPQLDEVQLSWYYCNEYPQDQIVVVEDQISALKVSRQYTTVALIGTHIGVDRFEEIRRVADGKPIILALDKDAVDKARNYARRFNLYADLRVALLDMDLKYEPDPRIEEIIEHAVE